MYTNILRNSDITKIFLFYTDANGSKKKENVKIRYMDNKESYFATALPHNFVKPKNKTIVNLAVYTADGVYKASVKLHDCTLSLSEVVFRVEIPKTWDFVQMRVGSRKLIELPGTLKFNDDFEINFTTSDLSVGGFTFLSNEALSSIYLKFPSMCTLEFPKNLIINFPDSKLETEVKFVRNKQGTEGNPEENFYALKFLQLSAEEKMILKNFLMSLE